MFENEQNLLENQIRAYCHGQGLPDPALNWTWIPFGGHWGISTSFFQLAAQEARQGKNVVVNLRAQELAQQVAQALSLPEGFEKAEAVKGYLNIYFSTADYTRQVIDMVLKEEQAFGRSPRLGKRIMVEFSQPNTHKAFHVGHLRSAILGDVLCRLLDCAGYDVVRANYPGDIGLHVIKWLWNYMKFHAGEKPQKDITRWMGDIYAEASRRLEENPDLEAEVREVYSRWDKHDPDVVAMWQETRQWSLEGFKDMYGLLGIQFDRYYFNSMFEQPGKEMVADLVARKIALDERPDGPVIVKIDEVLGLKAEKYRVLVVLRSDNTALYATEDIALARQKFLDYPDLEKAYYVVDVRQSLHFQQVFKTLEIAGFPWANRLEHISYELVNLPGNVVMASREGTIVLLEDLIREATQRALEVVKEKNPDLTDEQKLEVAKAVGLGAIKYPMLARENGKIVTFDWQTALDFNGQAAPYIQYAYVRAGSILRKAGGQVPPSTKPDYELNQAEINLVDMVSRLAREVQRSAAEMKPLNIATYSFELARAFNDFYTQCPVLQADPSVKNNRLRLVAAARQTLANSLALMGITAPQAM